MADIKIAGRIKAGTADNIAGYASEILFDDEASNKTVKEKLEGKQDTLTFDNVPTEGSNNPVKSGGVYQAIQSIDVSGQISGKADKSEMSVVAGTGANADKTTITLKSGTSATVLTQHQDVSEFLREGEVFGSGDDSAASFNSYADTVWNKQQTLSESQKQQVRENIGITDLETIRNGAAAGATAIQSVTVGTTTTGAAGSSASVVNSGTATAPVLDFTIPQGAQGVKGDTVIMGNEDTYTLYNTTGDAVDGAMTQQAVTRELAELAGELLGKESETTTILHNDVNISTGVINGTSLKWLAVGNQNYKHGIVQVSGYSKISFTATADHPVTFAFLKSYAPATNQSADLCDGTLLTGVPKGESREYNLPEDCNFVYFRALDSGNNEDVPETIILTTPAVKGVIEELEEYTTKNINSLTWEINGENQALTANKYFNTSFDPIGSTPSAFDGIYCTVIPVSVGEKYRIIGVGGSNQYARLWTTTDSTQNQVRHADNNYDGRTNPVVITIEEGEAYLYVNLFSYDAQTDKVQKAIDVNVPELASRIEGIPEVTDETGSSSDKAASQKLVTELDTEMDTRVEALEEIIGQPTEVTYTFAPEGIGGYINSTGYSVGDEFDKNVAQGQQAGFANYKIAVKSGDVVDIYGYGNGNSARLYILTNSLNIIVSLVGNKNTHTTPEVLNITEDGWLYVNDIEYSEGVGKVVIHRMEVVDGLEERLQEYVDTRLESINRLSGKIILIFGDSMSTAMDGNGKTYADYVGEITGADIINIAIGGTRFAQRNEPTLTPTSNTAYGNLDICNMVYAVCDNDFSYADAAVETLQRYSDIITLAKTVVPNNIDIIILQGGGNDYINGRNLGQADSFDKGTTLGALNYMIQKLCTTFPKAKIIGESNQVLYSVPAPFDASKNYVIGDVVLYSDEQGYNYYYFVNNHSGAWNANDVRLATPLEWRKTELFSDNDKRWVNLTLREMVGLYAERFAYYHIPYANMYETLGWNEYNFSSHYPNTDNHHPNDMLSWAEHLIGYLEAL